MEGREREQRTSSCSLKGLCLNTPLASSRDTRPSRENSCFAFTAFFASLVMPWRRGREGGREGEREGGREGWMDGGMEG